MKADYSTSCATCGKPIYVLDEIEYDTDAGGWGHAKCPPEPLHGAPCPKCFMERALDGSCMCDEDQR